jgi:hypothetical protein
MGPGVLRRGLFDGIGFVSGIPLIFRNHPVGAAPPHQPACPNAVEIQQSKPTAPIKRIL